MHLSGILNYLVPLSKNKTSGRALTMPLEDLNAWWKGFHRRPVRNIHYTANASA